MIDGKVRKNKYCFQFKIMREHMIPENCRFLLDNELLCKTKELQIINWNILKIVYRKLKLKNLHPMNSLLNINKNFGYLFQ